jgi:cytochrome oxidase Cu insertion factor (SCO1/SenC/PrrC family)
LPTAPHRSRRLAFALVALAVSAGLLAGCGASVSTGSQPAGGAQPTPTVGTTFDKPIPDAVAGIQFANQAGTPVSLQSLHGKIVVLTDFLTLCQEICPLTSSNLASLQRLLDQAGMTSKVQLVEVTVDPVRDTIPRLLAYQKLYGAHPNWDFLTGTPAQVAALWKSFGVAYDKVAEPPGPSPIDWWTGKPLRYDITHQDVVFVLGANGDERWLTEGSPDTQGSKPPTQLLKFLNADGKNNLAAPQTPSWTAADIAQAIAYVTGKPVK